MRHVAGIDPSLTSTGIAVLTETLGCSKFPPRIFLTVESYKPTMTGSGAGAEVARVQSVVEQVCESTHSAELILIEGLALSSRTGKYAERAHLYYSLHAAYLARRRNVDTVAPTSLKKLVTGNGRADKDQVLDAVRAAWSDRGWSDGLKTGRYDRADAAALAWVAAARSGWDVPELPGQPASRARAA